MPIITLKFKGRVLKDYPIDVGQTLTIGRNDSNDIVIDNMAVSGVHARIDSVSATFILTDLESTNGTFVNEKLISSHGLRNNDEIVIGKHSLLFDRSDIDRGAADNGVADDDDDKTRFLDTSEYRDMINKTAGKAPKVEKEPPLGDEPDGFISKIVKIFK